MYACMPLPHLCVSTALARHYCTHQRHFYETSAPMHVADHVTQTRDKGGAEVQKLRADDDQPFVFSPFSNTNPPASQPNVGTCTSTRREPQHTFARVDARAELRSMGLGMEHCIARPDSLSAWSPSCDRPHYDTGSAARTCVLPDGASVLCQQRRSVSSDDEKALPRPSSVRLLMKGWEHRCCI